ASSPLSSASSMPKAAARADFVRSSQVGPRPPVVMMRSARPLARLTASVTRPGLSPTTVCQWTSMPYSDRSTATSAASVFIVLPSSSSVPTEIISAFNVYPYPFDAFQRLGHEALYVHGCLRRGDVLDPRLGLG